MPTTMQQLPPGQTIAPKAEGGAMPAAAKDQKAIEIYRKLGLAAMKLIYDKKISKQLVEMMRAGADNPAEGVAHAASIVLSKMQEGVKGINPKLVYTVAPAVVVFLMELAGVAKLFKPDQKIMQQALRLVGEGVKQQGPQTAPAAAPPQGLITSQMQPQPMVA